MIWTYIGIVVGVIAVFVIGFLIGITYRKKVSEREISSAEDEAKRIINESIKAAEAKKREALVEAKEEIHRNRAEYEREVKERRAELQKQERRLQQKEETLDKKTDTIEKKTEALNQKLAAADAQQEEIRLIKKSQLEMLERISGYTMDEAKAYLIDSIKSEVTPRYGGQGQGSRTEIQGRVRLQSQGDHRNRHSALRRGPRK
jgi:ribonuclease Y